MFALQTVLAHATAVVVHMSGISHFDAGAHRGAAVVRGTKGDGGENCRS